MVVIDHTSYEASRHNQCLLAGGRNPPEIQSPGAAPPAELRGEGGLTCRVDGFLCSPETTHGPLGGCPVWRSMCPPCPGHLRVGGCLVAVARPPSPSRVPTCRPLLAAIVRRRGASPGVCAPSPLPRASSTRCTLTRSCA